MKKVLIVGRGLAPAVFDRTVSLKFAIMQIWSSLSLVRVQFKKTKRTEHIRQYTILVGLQGCATCYETVRRTVSPKFAIIQIWSSLSWFESNSKKEKTEHIRQYTILVGLQGCATCYETVHRTVSPKFVFAKFGAACRWFESIKKQKNGAHKRVLRSFGSPSWTRTNDPAVNSRMLYQLSY